MTGAEHIECGYLFGFLPLQLVFVRTYVNHVRNICHLELANPFTKRTLLVIR